MKQALVPIGLAVGLALATASAFAQTTPTTPQPPTTPSQSSQATGAGTQANCQKTPERVEGRVESIDPNQGRLMVRGSNGEMFSFNAPKDMLQSYKVGDHITAKLRSNPKC